MNVGKPTVSVLMPVYNCASTVSEAVASIVAQTFADWELIVIDDGSTDETLEVISKFSDSRIRVIEGRINKRLPARLNEAVALSTGKFIARMDGDDISYPERLRLQVDFLQSWPDVDLIGGSILIFDSNSSATGVRRAKLTHQEIIGSALRQSTLAHVTWCGRRDWFVRNPYNDRLSHAQDRELLTRTRRTSRFAAIPEILVGVREGSVTSKKQIPARKQLFKTFIREGLRQRSAAMLLISAPLELVKLGIDLAAIRSGLGYRMLKHRVPRIEPAEAKRWTEILRRVRGGVPRCLEVLQ
jgi:glycosyltransferase involved in cell wall biosynthesis